MVDQASASATSAVPSETAVTTCSSCVQLKQANVELEERCVSLRAMNEEVMGMLENMHSSDGNSA